MWQYIYNGLLSITKNKLTHDAVWMNLKTCKGKVARHKGQCISKFHFYVISKKDKPGWAQWRMPVIPAHWEAKVGRSLEARHSRSACPTW